MYIGWIKGKLKDAIRGKIDLIYCVCVYEDYASSIHTYIKIVLSCSCRDEREEVWFGPTRLVL